jgi:hypothetical protein
MWFFLCYLFLIRYYQYVARESQRRLNKHPAGTSQPSTIPTCWASSVLILCVLPIISSLSAENTGLPALDELVSEQLLLEVA